MSNVEELIRNKKKIQSSIPSLSVGDERKCFNQIRKAATYIRPESLLWNGWPAGKFALDYVIGHHMKRKRKAEEKLDQIPEDQKKRKRTRNRVFDELEALTSLEAIALEFQAKDNKCLRATFDKAIQ